MSPDSAIVSEIKLIKMPKDHLLLLVGYFDDYCQILELFPLLGERNSGMMFLEDISAQKINKVQ